MIRKDQRKIGEILIEELNISSKYVQEVLKKAKNDEILFGMAAEKLKLIDKEKIAYSLSIQYGLKYLSYINAIKIFYYDNYKDETIFKELFNFPTEDHYMEYCLENKIFVLNKSDNENAFTELFDTPTEYNENGKGSIVIVTDEYDNFRNEAHLRNIKEIFKNVYICGITSAFFKYVQTRYFSPTLKEMEEFFRTVKEDTKTEIALKMLLTYVISNEISDLHIEPNYDGKFRIAGRKDGERISFFYIDMEFASRLIAVIKNKSELPQETKKVPLDGQLSGNEELLNYTLPIKRGVDKREPTFNFSDTSFRISTYPNADNLPVTSESVVARNLNSNETLAVLENLNLSKQTEKEILYNIQQRNGIIIVSGPTGSGKSTTLYALLNKIDYLSEKIITFEDPVEIRNRFWTQGEKNISTNDAANFTFELAKKSILRQDPDIILMGEIRDEESALFALEAANTGHLVLATLHANNSILVINRLMELSDKIKKSEIINTLRCSFSQRLVKNVCPHCRIKSDPNNETYKEFYQRHKIPEANQPKVIYELNHNGCKFCNYTGFKGRILIDEVITFDENTKEQLLSENNMIKVRQSISKNYNTMLINGLKKVEEGIIPFSELNKLI